MNESNNKTLVSMFVFGFNQERYIADAIDAAFAQTYSPLEIIISDDCSDDNTYAVMQEKAKHYRGPHRVVLNRNVKNLGKSAHIAHCLSLSRGAWIVDADGDDVSLPNRVERIMERRSEDPLQTHLIYSGHIRITNEGTPVETHLEPTLVDPDFERDFLRQDAYTLGATSSYSRECFEAFGALTGRYGDDHILPFRAAILGNISFIAEPLIKYRVWAGTSVANAREKLTLRRMLNYKCLSRNIKQTQRSCERMLSIVRRKIVDASVANRPMWQVELLRHREEGLLVQIMCLKLPFGVACLSRLIKARGVRAQALRCFLKVQMCGCLKRLRSVR